MDWHCVFEKGETAAFFAVRMLAGIIPNQIYQWGLNFWDSHVQGFPPTLCA